MNEATQAT